jgi:hypothetical protein
MKNTGGESLLTTLRVTLILLSFALYGAAVLMQGEYLDADWAGENTRVLPAAISFAAYGAPLGMLDENVKGAYLSESTFPARLEKVAPGNAHDIPRGHLSVVGLGAGYTVFASLAMKFFGVTTNALPLGLLSLLAISTVVFVFRFRDNWAFVVPVQFLSLTFMLITLHGADVFNSPQVGGAHYVAMLVALPTTYIIFELLDTLSGAAIGNLRFVPFAIQASLLAIAIEVRESGIYSLLAILLATFVGFRMSRTVDHKIRKLFCVYGTLAAMFVVVHASLLTALPAEYRQPERLFTGNVWHRIFNSLAVNPAWPYDEHLRQMFPCTNAFPGGLSQQSILDYASWCAWWASQPDAHPTPEQAIDVGSFDFYKPKYEEVVRHAFFRVVAAYPKQVFETFTYYKSLMVVDTLRSALTIRWSRPRLIVPVIPFLLAQFAVFMALIVLGPYGRRQIVAPIGSVMLGMFILSLLPAYAAYSILETSTDTIMFMYCCLATLLAIALNALWNTSVVAAGTIWSLRLSVNQWKTKMCGVVGVVIVLTTGEAVGYFVNGPKGDLVVHSATYGANCGAPPGNATQDVKDACEGTHTCQYYVDMNIIGDAVQGCAKDFSVEYACGAKSAARATQLAGEASGKTINLTCELSDPRNAPAVAVGDPEVTVVNASYGLNCRDSLVPMGFAKWTNPGNVTDPVKHACDGRVQCSYLVEASKIGDPANNCSKDFSVEYICTRAGIKAESNQTNIAHLPGEADGKTVNLMCGRQQ